MRTIRFLLRKEFKQIFRNKALLPLIFIAPIMQLLILPLAANYTVKNINVTIVDNDNTPSSRAIIHKIEGSNYFNLTAVKTNYQKAFKDIETNNSDLVLEIPQHFEKNLTTGHHPNLFMAVNSINGVKANLGASYLNQIIEDFNKNILLKRHPQPVFNPLPKIQITQSNWFNPTMNYHNFMVPGILVLLVTMIGVYMSGLNIVKEKEVGTIEQINVSPIKKHQFILGKLIPFWIIGMIVFTVGLFGISWLIYGIVPLGNIFLLYGYLAIYLIAVLGLGLLISTYSSTQQQAMSVAFFFMMIFMLMSGLFTPIESMPKWAYIITQFSPVTYFVKVIRMIVLKGSDFVDIQYHFIIMLAFAMVFNGWAILNFKKSS